MSLVLTSYSIASYLLKRLNIAHIAITVLGAQVAVALVRGLLAAVHEAALAATVCPAKSMGDCDLGAARVLAARTAAVRPADAARFGALRAALDRAARVATVFPAQPAVLGPAVAFFHGAPLATL